MSSQKERKLLLWLNRHQKALRKYAGRWVGIKPEKGVVASGRSLKKVCKEFLKHFPGEKPHLLQIPPKGQQFYILIFS